MPTSPMPYLTGLTDIAAALDAVSTDARTAFSRLSPNQLNWKPNPEKWSVGQCLDHLIATNSPYFPIFEKIAAGTRQPTIWERMPIFPGMLGAFFLKAVDPGATGKVTAPPAFRPTTGDLPGDIVTRFLDHQTALREKIEKLSGVDLTGTVITSPALAVVTYSLLDALNIITRHERRHFNQAVRVTETAGFPA